MPAESGLPLVVSDRNAAVLTSSKQLVSGQFLELGLKRLHAVRRGDSQQLWIAGDGVILTSTDRGTTWQAPLALPEIAAACRFRGGGYGRAVGLGRRRTWQLRFALTRRRYHLASSGRPERQRPYKPFTLSTSAEGGWSVRWGPSSRLGTVERPGCDSAVENASPR